MEKQLGVTSSQEQLVSDMVYMSLLITQNGNIFGIISNFTVKKKWKNKYLKKV